MSVVAVEAERAIVDGRDVGATCVLIEDGTIVSVGPRGRLEIPAEARKIVWDDHVLVPGTVNVHNHSFQSLLRGLGDDLPFLAWRDQALYRYSPRLGADGLHTGALFAFAEMLLHGVTTVCDFFYINDGGNENASAVIEAGRRLGMRTVLARCFYDWDGAPASYRETPARASKNFQALRDRYLPDPLVDVQAAPHSLHGASREMLIAAGEAARAAGTRMHIHLAEEEYQVGQALARYGQRPLRVIDQLGLLDERTVAVHGCWFDPGERALLAERQASLAYCPSSNMFLGDGVTDIVDLVRRGARVGLGSDGGCSNSRVGIFEEMRACALLQKVHRIDGQAIDAETCFAMGTVAGGELLGLPVGRIAPGYKADLVALSLGDPSLWPLGSLAKNVVYSLSARAVSEVLVEGELVVSHGRLTRVAIEEIRKRVAELTHDWRRS